MRLDGEQLLKRFAKAKSSRGNWEDLWEDIYDYTMPAREGFYYSVPGEERTDRIFDETALVALADFVSIMQAGTVPPNEKWFRLEPGPEVPPSQRAELQAQLDLITDFIWDAISNSNFAVEAQEVLNDLGVGWSTLIVEDGIDGKLLNFKCVPQCHCYWDTGGKFKQIDGVFRVRTNVRIAELTTIWPDATISKQLQGKMKSDPDCKTNLVEASYRDWKADTPTYYYQVVATEDKSLVVDDVETGLGARPYLTPRWAVSAGEVYGRGPLVNALPAIRTVNTVTEMILENAQMAISGLWQVDDDSTINVHNVEIVPGAVYPRPADSRGLERTDSPANFNVADLVLANEQENIRRALYAQNLGPLDKTPRSATEIAERVRDRAEETSGPSARQKAEWIDPMIQRIVWLFTRRGILEMPRLDGRQVRVVSKSPFARAVRFEEIDRMRGFAGDVIGILGPQIGQVYLNGDELVDELREKWEVPTGLVRDEREREEVGRQVSDMLQEGGTAPGGLPAQAPIG